MLSAEIIIKKSRFISYCYEVYNIEEVSDRLAEVRRLHKDPSHVCFAFSIGFCGLIEKFNDDGEPKGTAGRPILNVIHKQKRQNILICVVRYFGGIKLGSGGLIRAYTKAASEVLKLV